MPCRRSRASASLIPTASHSGARDAAQSCLPGTGYRWPPGTRTDVGAGRAGWGLGGKGVKAGQGRGEKGSRLAGLWRAWVPTSQHLGNAVVSPQAGTGWGRPQAAPTGAGKIVPAPIAQPAAPAAAPPVQPSLVSAAPVPQASLASDCGSRMVPARPSYEAWLGSSCPLHTTLSHAILASTAPSWLGLQLPHSSP